VLATAAIISAVVGAASAGVGLWQSKKARDAQSDLLKEQQKRADEQAAENKAWYERERSIPTLEREENKAAISAATEAVKEQNSQAESRMAIMGGSSEAGVAQRANSMKTIGQLARDIAAGGTKYKQMLDSQYHGLKSQENAMSMAASSAQMGALGQQSANASQLVNNGIAAFGSGVTEYGKAKQPAVQPPVKP
jgi:hypothetical protein